ncbi:MAG: hypothetical protein ABFQ95_06305, partial [Pseudomonadota bacterium]
ENNEQNDRQTRTTPIPARKPDFGPRGVSNWDPDTSGWDSQQFVPQVNLSEEFSIPRTQSAQHALQPQPNLETRGRMSVREQPAPQRNVSPTRLPDTYFEQGVQGVTSEIGTWTTAKDQLLAGDMSSKTLSRTAGYGALEGLSYAHQGLDAVTLGLWSEAGDAIEYLSDGVRTGIRRGTRWVTGDQRLGQNAGDYVYAALSIVGPKKFLAPVEIAKKSQTLSKVARAGQKLASATKPKAAKATKISKNLPSKKPTAWRMQTSGKVKLEALDLNGMWNKSMRGGSAGFGKVPVSPNVNIRGVQLGSRNSRLQPWTVRPGQEWKMKIVGRGQRTKTPGHALESYKIAIREAKKPQTQTVLLDKGVNRALPENIRPNRRPDVLVVQKNQKINQHEVQSISDRPNDLMARMDDTRSRFPKDLRGENKLHKIPGVEYPHG